LAPVLLALYLHAISPNRVYMSRFMKDVLT